MFSAELKFEGEPYSASRFIEKIMETANATAKDGNKIRIEIKVFEVESAKVPAEAIS